MLLLLQLLSGICRRLLDERAELAARMRALRGAAASQRPFKSRRRPLHHAEERGGACYEHADPEPDP